MSSSNCSNVIPLALKAFSYCSLNFKQNKTDYYGIVIATDAFSKLHLRSTEANRFERQP